MRAEEIQKLDATRGQGVGNYDEYDSFPEDDLPRPSKKLPVNKSEDYMNKTKEATDLLKALPKEPKKEDTTPVSKAMTTRSFPVKAHDITRSAITTTTRGHSALKGPDGVAPLVGETLQTVAELERKRGPIYKSCESHGLVFRSDLGCRPCYISKSNMCKACKGALHKAPGDVMVCKNCG